MKGIFVILDGIGDLPCKQLENKTPLESAITPNLDFLASNGELGYLYPVKKGFIPESDEAIVSIFGNELSSSTRGRLEAKGVNAKLVRGDLALRANFGTIDSLEDKNVIDRRAGRNLTSKESREFAKSVNIGVKMPFKFNLIPSIQHRGVLIFNGGFSDSVLGNDFTYFQGKNIEEGKIKECKPTDDEDNSGYTTNMLNLFLKKAFNVLDKHPLNNKRRINGFLPANYLFVRGAGIEEPNLKQYSNWMSICYMPLEIGFSTASGMKVFSFEYPELEDSNSYKNLYSGLSKLCDFSKKILKENLNKKDYVYIHVKETDLPGHDNKPLEKKKMIEYLDKNLFEFIKEFAKEKGINVLVTGDHSTPCNFKRHSYDPVPVLFYSGDLSKSKKRFCEKDAINGTLGEITGKELLIKTGFNK